MLTDYYRTLSAGKLFGRALLSGLLLCCLTDLACSQPRSVSDAVDVTRRRIDLIPAGTVIEKSAPHGWTNLIIKSHPRPGAGDVEALSRTANRLARLFFTAIVARVDSEEAGGGKRYRLARVAVGMGANVRGKDMILTPDSWRRLGASLPFLGGVVLSKAYDKLQEITLPVQSSTLALIDVPGLMQLEERHQPVLLRYALLVDKRTGKIDTLLWAMRRKNPGAPLGPLQWLPEDKLNETVLHVDAREFALGNPTEEAFAMTGLPRGKKEITVPDELKAALVRDRFTEADATELEGKLRKLLEQAAK